MSKEAVRLFIEKVEQDEELKDLVHYWYNNHDVNLVPYARKHGFDFTEEEGKEVWEEIQNEEELSDFALELISGGWAQAPASAPADPITEVPPRGTGDAK
jgi:predicted ribosomally synthesized peptide with nif11-like leader